MKSPKKGKSMPSGGQNRLPTEVKRKKGTLRPGRMLVGVPSPVAAQIGEPPDQMSDSQKVMWYRLKEAVSSLNVAAIGDMISFELMVIAVDKHIRNMYDPESDGSSTFPQAFKLMCAFGLTPQSRTAVRVVTDEKSKSDDPLSEFFN